MLTGYKSKSMSVSIAKWNLKEDNFGEKIDQKRQCPERVVLD
jgi:hypothetical protein